jgi:hypothetical protein
VSKRIGALDAVKRFGRLDRNLAGYFHGAIHQ